MNENIDCEKICKKNNTISDPTNLLLFNMGFGFLFTISLNCFYFLYVESFIIYFITTVILTILIVLGLHHLNKKNYFNNNIIFKCFLSIILISLTLYSIHKNVGNQSLSGEKLTSFNNKLNEFSIIKSLNHNDENIIKIINNTSEHLKTINNVPNIYNYNFLRNNINKIKKFDDKIQDNKYEEEKLNETKRLLNEIKTNL